ncbi:MAG: response regulator [Bacteroidota bacterium]
MSESTLVNLALDPIFLKTLHDIQHPVLVLNTEGVIRWSNRAYNSVCQADVKGVSPVNDTLILGEKKKSSATYIQLYEQFRSHQPFHAEFPNFSYLDQPYWLRMTLEPLEGKHPSFPEECLFLAFGEDITKGKNREARFSFIETAVESIKDSVIITQAQSQTDALIDVGIIYVNPALSKLTGYTPEEILGKTPRIFQGPQTSQTVLDSIDQAIEKQEAIEVEYINYRKDGSEFWANTLITPVFNEKGELTNWVSIRRDISERKKAELELRKMVEEVKVASNAKTAFLSTISHELRTPLNGMIGSSELLLASELTEEQKESVEMIQKSSENLLGIIRSILDFSDLDKDFLNLKLSYFDPVDFLSRVSEMYSYAARRQGLDLSLHLDPGLPKLVQSDIYLLSKAFNHLVLNAIKFTEKGKISLFLRTREEFEGKALLEFAVKDTGIGIPIEEQHKLFQTFSQIDTSNTRKHGGLGLGLAMCEKISRILGGSIRAESEEQKGSTFFFSFKGKIVRPKKINATQSLHSKDSQPGSSEFPDLSSYNILVVEDNTMNQRLITKMLKKVNAHWELANNGQEAVEYVKENKVDFVIMDIQMPVMDGIEATRMIRAMDHIDQPIIVALTANGSKENEHNCYNAGMDDFLTKPLKLSFFREYAQKLEPVLLARVC